MDIFDFDNFRDYIKENLRQLPNQGHGQNKRMAQAAGVSTAFFSQVLADKRQLSMEQASLLADFFGLSELQSEYFLTLVQMDRAGNVSLRRQMQKQLSRIKASARTISNRFIKTNEVSDEDKPMYYSDWLFIAVQQLTAIESYQSEHQIAERLNVPLKKIKEVVSFLLRTGLCIEKDNKIAVGAARIHLSSDSPWIKQHHINWRLRAIEKFHAADETRMHYSSPMTLSAADCEKVREILLAAIGNIGKVVDPSPSEELACLNIDWFKI